MLNISSVSILIIGSVHYLPGKIIDLVYRINNGIVVFQFMALLVQPQRFVYTTNDALV